MLPVVVPTLPPPLPSSPDDRPRNRGSDGVVGRDPRSPAHASLDAHRAPTAVGELVFYPVGSRPHLRISAARPGPRGGNVSTPAVWLCSAVSARRALTRRHAPETFATRPAGSPSSWRARLNLFGSYIELSQEFFDAITAQSDK
jgi:hypothetical protein